MGTRHKYLDDLFSIVYANMTMMEHILDRIEEETKETRTILDHLRGTLNIVEEVSHREDEP